MQILINAEYRACEEIVSKKNVSYLRLYFEDSNGTPFALLTKKQAIIEKNITLKKGNKYNLTLDFDINKAYFRDIVGG